VTYPEQPVLLVDDERAVLAGEARVLAAAGINNVVSCGDPREVMALLARTGFDAVLLDITMPGLSGEKLLELIREHRPELPVIMVTALADVDAAVRCIRAGAFDYMVKPVEPSRLASGVRRAVEMRALSRRYESLRERVQSGGLAHPEAFSAIVTTSRRMLAALALADALAPTAETILVTGETGTGKELVAEAIHRASGRRGPLVTVNAAGLDDTMFADALFGHRKGAFTGADENRPGLVQQAEDGTLFLDEIGDLNAQSQVKLLRLLERHEYTPLGSDVTRASGARFVIATHRDLRALVASGAFRADLYYRIQTHETRLPPLRERPEDLMALVDRFLGEACSRLEKPRLALPPQLADLLASYHFPGNVRELRSMVFAAVGRQKSRMLSLDAFREAMGRSPAPALAGNGEAPAAEAAAGERIPTLKEATDSLIARALERGRGNHAIAAGLLGISPQALSKRLSRRAARGGRSTTGE
jgi:DNA-binding NtrC family response regulator